ncbi:unnamed protein product [Xylocopa violacea]|uniref:Large ribosomal subunit protein bL36m n=1 Tax=Xylocopa violacea TaxID=135666 RepID=A0ABP1NFK2_XYLVO
MNASSLFKTVCQTLVSLAPKMSLIEPCTRVINRNMHYMCNKQYSYNLSNVCTNKTSSTLLQPLLPMYNFACGLKMKTILKRRCKSCIICWKNDRKYVICKEKPRHNQVERKKEACSTWILTSASQSKVREW